MDEDEAALLAELQAISNRSSGADRWASSPEEDDDQETPAPVVEAPAPAPPPPKATRPKRATPPWKKRKSPVKQSNGGNNDDVVVAAPPKQRDHGVVKPWQRKSSATKSSENDDDVVVTAAPKAVSPPPTTIKSNLPNTFQGERGGAAEDAELLAELRAISQGASANRFEDAQDDDEPPAAAPPPTVIKSNLPNTFKGDRGGAAEDAELLAELRAISSGGSKARPVEPEPEEESTPAPPPTVIKSNLPNTFKGDRGGAAEDAELLAELRAISSGGSKPTPVEQEPEEESTPAAPPPTVIKSNLPNTFKGERGGAAEDAELLAELRAISSGGSKARPVEPEPEEEEEETPAPPPTVIKSNLPNTFKGERGGAAEDAELLAELRAISSGGAKAPTPIDKETKMEEDAPAAPPPTVIKSNLPNTFKGDRGGAAEDEELLAELRAISAGGASRRSAHPSAATSTVGSSTSGFPASSPPPPAAASPAEEIVITREDMPDALKDKNWKVRKQAYIFLSKEISSGHKADSSIDGNSILPNLDDLIATCLMDKNANAVESALQLALDYADYCKGATEGERAAKIVQAMIKGNGFSSPRPAAAKLSTAVSLKLVEVAQPDASNTIFEAILTEGVHSKKPKVVQLSVKILLETAKTFGAVVLPLAPLTAELPSLLEHSNKNVRDGALQVTAEVCRALGSKEPLDNVTEKMKKAQLKELDALLDKQPKPSPPTRTLRSSSGKLPEGAGDALQALQAGAAERAAAKFAKREAVDLMKELPKTEFKEKLKLAKWSEKVAALDIALSCGGEQPYKLVQPSSSSNYAPLISDMKGLLSHTHFAVVSKAMAVLAMLADGVGEKLYPNLRPLVGVLLGLSKDKKLTKAVASCLDSFFGNVIGFEHLLDPDNSLPEALDEKKQKNTLARVAAVEFLLKCIERRDTAGPRGSLSAKHAKDCAQLCVDKLQDSDAGVRKACTATLKVLRDLGDPDASSVVRQVIDSLQTSNPRAYKALASGTKKPAATTRAPQQQSQSKSSSQADRSSPDKLGGATPHIVEPREPAPLSRSVPSKKTVGTPSPSKKSTLLPIDDADAPGIDEATAHVGALGMGMWGAADEDGGIRAGVESTKWLYRQNALKAIALFVSHMKPKEEASAAKDAASLLVFVREHTRGFKETNVNVMRGIFEFFLALCGYLERSTCLMPTWSRKDIVGACVLKIFDRKLSEIAKSVLTELCVVQLPSDVHLEAYAAIADVKSPLGHEEFLNWMKVFLREFGSKSLGNGMKETVEFLIGEFDSSNVKVKRASVAVLGLMHTHIGPALQAVALNATRNSSTRESLEKAFADHPHDKSASSDDWPKITIASIAPSSSGGSGGSEAAFEVPKTDLFEVLPADILDRMGSKESKTAWKVRKAALEEVESQMKSCSGLLDSSRLKPMADLLRCVRERLGDSQSNLKPIAARLIGLIMSHLDATAQSKMGKIVYGPLINCAMNDNKKVMHDTCLEALRLGTSKAALEGGGVNELSMEPFISALVAELEGSEFKAGGIPDVFSLATEFAMVVPNLDNVNAQGGKNLGEKFSKVFVESLTSSKADVRTASEALLTSYVEQKVIDCQSLRKAAGRMKPALQRTVMPVISKLSTSTAPIAPLPPLSPKAESPKKSFTSRLQNAKKSTVLPSEHSKDSSSMRQSKSVPVREIANGAGNSSSLHPLVGQASSTAMQRSRAALRMLTWPEYPEEPIGSSLFSGLKKAWAPVLPPESVAVLFPTGGFRKQDDAKDGCELLTKAIAIEKSGEDLAIVEQLDLILKWAVMVVCTRESPVGLQALLVFLGDLIRFLLDSRYELSDIETMQVVPFLYDKASAAKGRFREAWMEVVDAVRAEALVPVKRLGPVVCVAIIETSSHAKARVMACADCARCVEKIGLPGIGKKGVVAAVKSLSEEKLPENKAALLDLIVAFLPRMNDDVSRLAKICGPALSDKARSLIEEKLEKGGGDSGPMSATTHTSSIPSGLKAPSAGIRRQSRAAASPAKAHQNPLSKSLPVQRPKTDSGVSSSSFSSFADELPSLDLRFNSIKSSIANSGRKSIGGVDAATPRKSFQMPVPEPVVATDSGDSDEALLNSLLSADENDLEEVTNDNPIEDDIPNYGLEEIKPASSFEERLATAPTTGAAASLRARLLKIRERNMASNDSTSELPSAKTSTNDTPSSPVSRKSVEKASKTDGIEQSLKPSLFNQSIANIGRLLNESLPLPEDAETLLGCTETLKAIHAAISRQPDLVADIPANEIVFLRESIVQSTNELVSHLTQLISFCFKCHETDLTAGISIPLLSVDLACLMAIFRGDDTCKKVNQDELTLLIREASTALLDPRLASSGSLESASDGLDEQTATQLVRAINKLAVQASTGSRRDASFPALLTLQLQLGLNKDEDEIFASRLSRVVAKLFARVIKSEEGASIPFSSVSMDMEVVLCALDDALTEAVKSDDGGVTDLARSLVVAILNAQGGPSSIRNVMADLGIHAQKSQLGQLVDKCALSLDMDTAGVAPVPTTASSMSERLQNLRSKLSQTEAAVQSAVDGPPPKENLPLSNLKQPSPTKLQSPAKETSNTSSATVQALRQRLAAAQSHRQQEEAAKNAAPQTEVTSSRAAALRARLEAVKRQNGA